MVKNRKHIFEYMHKRRGVVYRSSQFVDKVAKHRNRQPPFALRIKTSPYFSEQQNVVLSEEEKKLLDQPGEAANE
jgi:hypothetical protein